MVGLMKATGIRVCALFGTLVLAGCGGDVSAELSGPGLPGTGSPLEQPQVVATGDGDLLLVWTARSDSGVDIFLSRTEGNEFQPPVRVNDSPGSLNRLPIDEMRPSVAVGPDGQVAVAWTDTAFDIQAGVSADGGRTFGPAVRLNRDEGEALQEFPSIAFDPAGRLHAAWLDPRAAGPGLEEPADLYYTALDVDGRPGPEMNLTGAQESSVCGCCLPDLEVAPDGALRITFRNTTEDGYRDPFRITGREGQFTAPQPVSPPVWRLDACPVAGPIGVGDMTLWLDGSTGTQRLLSAFDPAREPDAIFEDSATQLLLLPPRLVSGLPTDAPVVLVPMADNSRLIAPEGHAWQVLADDLPFWVTSAAVHEGRLIMVGIAEGFQMETRPFDSGI